MADRTPQDGDLEFVQFETFERTYTYDDDGTPGSFTGWEIRSQVRASEKVTAQLLLDLTPYFTVSADGASATLRVPATAWVGVDASKFRAAMFDIFLVDENDPTNTELFMQGQAFCDLAVTQVVSA